MAPSPRRPTLREVAAYQGDLLRRVKQYGEDTAEDQTNEPARHVNDDGRGRKGKSQAT